MTAVDFDLRFTYVLAVWEGTTHNALVLRDALKRENGLRIPQGIHPKIFEPQFDMPYFVSSTITHISLLC
jgi:hypothetical protein